jgi:CRISPR-associated protein Cmr5
MNRNIDQLIPPAMDAVNKHIVNHKPIYKKYKGAIPSEYNGYISSFGGAVLQSGLKAAVAFNENKNTDAEKDKTPLMNAILDIVTQNDDQQYKSLLDYILSHPNKLSQIQESILDAATAIKLVIRTFELKKEEKR